MVSYLIFVLPKKNHYLYNCLVLQWRSVFSINLNRLKNWNGKNIRRCANIKNEPSINLDYCFNTQDCVRTHVTNQGCDVSNINVNN